MSDQEDNKIKVSKEEYWAIKTAIGDRIYNLYSVIKRQETIEKSIHWLDEIDYLEKFLEKIFYK